LKLSAEVADCPGGQGVAEFLAMRPGSCSAEKAVSQKAHKVSQTHKEVSLFADFLQREFFVSGWMVIESGLSRLQEFWKAFCQTAHPQR
jgi:hypothetical protein